MQCQGRYISVISEEKTIIGMYGRRTIFGIASQFIFKETIVYHTQGNTITLTGTYAANPSQEIFDMAEGRNIRFYSKANPLDEVLDKINRDKSSRKTNPFRRNNTYYPE